MEVTCETCNEVFSLNESAADRGNWESERESRVVVDDEVGSILISVPVANVLRWQCDNGHSNTVREAIEE